MDDSQLTLRSQPVSPGSAMPRQQSNSPRLTGDEDLNPFDRFGCTLEIKSDQAVPKTPAIYLKWRLAILEIKLKMIAMRKQASTEVSEVDEHDTGTYKSNLMALKKGEKTFLLEKTFILAQRKSLAEDLSDVIIRIDQLEPAYIEEHRMALTTASSSKHTWSRRKVRRQKRWPFATIVHEYLDTRRYPRNTRIVVKRCNITGLIRLPACAVKCARIVPHSWSDKDMAHIFGSEEFPLTSRRNRLSMLSNLEPITVGLQLFPMAQ